MPGYYKVEVLEIDKVEASVKLHVRMFNPDGGRIYQSVGFGLALLDNGKLKSSSLASEFESDDLYDEKWAKKYANGFVKKVVKEDQEPMISHEMGGDYALPSAIISIYCTDKAWLEHLTVGEEWESYAYEVARSYDQCEPILFGKKESVDPEKVDSSTYWMPVPSFLFDQGTYKLPNTVYLPEYTESSYVVDTIIEIPKEELSLLKDFHGKYIMDMDEQEAGILVWNGGENYANIYSVGNNHRGGTSYYTNAFRSLQKVGLLVPKANFKRHNKRTNYAKLFSSANPLIKSAKREGRMIHLEVAGITDLEDLRLHKGRILKLICNNFTSTYGRMDADYPLSQLLQYFAKKKDWSPGSILNDVADGIILNYEIDSPEQALEDFDSWDREALIDYFDQEKWPCYTFHIEISDEAFGLQIDQITKTSKTISLISTGGDIVEWEQAILWKDYKDLVNRQ